MRTRNGAAKGRRGVYRLGGVKFIQATCRTAFNRAARHRMPPPYARNPFGLFPIDKLRDASEEAERAAVFSPAQGDARAGAEKAAADYLGTRRGAGERELKRAVVRFGRSAGRPVIHEPLCHLPLAKLYRTRQRKALWAADEAGSPLPPRRAPPRAAAKVGYQKVGYAGFLTFNSACQQAKARLRRSYDRLADPPDWPLRVADDGNSAVGSGDGARKAFLNASDLFLHSWYLAAPLTRELPEPLGTLVGVSVRRAARVPGPAGVVSYSPYFKAPGSAALRHDVLARQRKAASKGSSPTRPAPASSRWATRRQRDGLPPLVDRDDRPQSVRQEARLGRAPGEGVPETI